MSLILIERITNLNGPIIPDTLNGVLNGSEIDAHKFVITATRDGAAVALTGTVTASFLRADGAEVVLTGEIENSAATVTLAQSCYAVPGRFDLTIFVTADGVKTGVYACTGGVRNTTSGTIVDPGQIVPSVDDIIAKQEELAQDVADASSAIASAQNAVSYLAPGFSTSKTYKVGEYVTQDGALYICTIAIETAGAWDAANWQAVTFGGEVTNLKSEIDVIYDAPIIIDKLSYSASRVDNSLKRVLAIIPANSYITKCQQLLTRELINYVELQVYEYDAGSDAYIYARSITAKSVAAQGDYYLHDFGQIATRNGCLLTFNDTTSSGWLRGEAASGQTMYSFDKTLTSVTKADFSQSSWSLGSYVEYLVYSADAKISEIKSSVSLLNNVPLHELSGTVNGTYAYHGNAGDVFEVFNNFGASMSLGLQLEKGTAVQVVTVANNSSKTFTAESEFNYIYIYTSDSSGSWKITDTGTLTYRVDKNIENVEELNTLVYPALNKSILNPKKPRFSMHRGASRRAPENTVPAFEIAGQMGAWGIETDIYRTTDGYFMCSHDNDISGKTDAPSGTKITENTYATIRSYTINTQTIDGITYSGLKIPTIQEYLGVCSLYGCVPNVEIKSIMGHFEDVHDILIDYGYGCNCVVIQYMSFYSAIRKAMPNVTFMLNLASDTNYESQIDNITTYGDRNIIISMQYDNADVDFALLAKCHQLGYATLVWSVNDSTQVDNYLRMGIDIITSDVYATRNNA